MFKYSSVVNKLHLQSMFLNFAEVFYL